MAEYYKEAQKLAQKDYRACISAGKNPCLPVLEDFVSTKAFTKGIDLGLVQIPAELIVGTKTRGRVNAFSSNFMPILDEDTEFADKWNRLCNAHLNEGIREPIKAYEYMNRFYVEEGNKRVSVLKFFDAVTIVGHVIRIMPEGNEESDEAIDLHKEFVEFYKYSKINYVEFSKKGSYSELLKLLGKGPSDVWTDEDRNEFSGVFYYFKKAYFAKGGAKLQIQDAKGEVTAEWTSSDDSIVEVKGLNILEHYFLIETSAPKGFKIADTIEFYLEEDGTIVLVSGGNLVDNVLVMIDAKVTVDKKVKTGDDMNAALWAALAAAAAASAGIIVLARRKKEKK